MTWLSAAPSASGEGSFRVLMSGCWPGDRTRSQRSGTRSRTRACEWNSSGHSPAVRSPRRGCRAQRRGASGADRGDADLRFTDDPLNGSHAGRTIGLSSLSRAFPAYGLRLLTWEDTRVLAHYARSDGSLGAPALGGRRGNGLGAPVVNKAKFKVDTRRVLLDQPQGM